MAHAQGVRKCSFPQYDPLCLAVPPHVELTPNMEEVHMEIGQKITLQCDAEGKPEPDVVWTLPDPDELTVSGHL